MKDDWTDKRMDDFADRVGRFEIDVKERFDRVDAQFDKVDVRFDKVDARFGKLEAKVDATNRTIWCGIFVAVAVKLLFG